MPQISPEYLASLRGRWETPTKALRQLVDRFYVQTGTIYPKAGTNPTVEDRSAIDYLVIEWDYGDGGNTL